MLLSVTTPAQSVLIEPLGPANGFTGFGDAVAGLDFNGDGFLDAATGIPSDPFPRVLLFFGGPGADDVVDVELQGPAGVRFGHVLASAGDVNNDGFDDLLVSGGGYTQSESGPAAFLFLGGPNPAPPIGILEPANGRFFNMSLAGAGDINGDGFDDFAVGNPNGANPGRVSVYLGGIFLDPVPAFNLTESQVFNFGGAVQFTDWNQDGFSDVFVGPEEGGDSEQVWVYLGGNPFNTLADTRLPSVAAEQGFGTKLAAGDVNGDSFSDLVVGVSQAGPLGGGGRMVIYLGSAVPDSLRDAQVAFPDFPDPPLRFQIWAGSDFNQDGFSDIVVGSGVPELVRVYNGTGDLADLQLAIPIPGPPGTAFGASVSGGGDFNNDGVDEIVAGAPLSPGGGTPLGSMAVISLQPLCFQSELLLDFGSVEVGFADTLYYEITNLGLFPLDLTPAISNCSDFAAEPGVLAVQPGQTESLSVIFSPSGAGVQNCTMSLGNQECAPVDLTGVGSQAICDLSVSSVSFGDVKVGDFAETNVTVTNLGDADLRLDLSLLGSECSEFTISEPPQVTLIPGGVHEIGLTYSPVDTGFVSCVVSLGSPSCQDIQVSGTGTQAECAVSATVLNFGDVDLDSTANETLLVRNPGRVDLVLDPSLMGAGCAEFGVTSGQVVPALDSIEVVVSYSPTSEGGAACTLDLGNSLCSTVSLLGQGVAATGPICMVTPTSLGFPGVSPGDRVSLVFTVQNSGDADLNGTLSLSGADCEQFQVDGNPNYSVLPQASRTFVVWFIPLTEGDSSCSIDLGNNLCPEVPVTGTGTASPVLSCSVAPAELDFKNVQVGKSDTTGVTVFNTGDITFSIDVNVDCPGFSIVGDGAHTIPWGESVEIQVVFAPPDSGEYLCTMDTGLRECGVVSVVGSGVLPPPGPACSVFPDTLEFGVLTPGSVRELTVTVLNGSDIPLQGTVQLSDCAHFDVPEPDYFVPEGESREILVRYTANTPGDAVCTLVIEDCGEVVLIGSQATLTTVIVPAFDLRVHQLWSPPVATGLSGTQFLQDIFVSVFGSMSPVSWRGFAQRGDLIEENPAVSPGSAYWINTVLQLPSGFAVTGYAEEWRAVPVSPGWNTVGSPFLQPTALRDVAVRMPGGLTAAMDSAVALGWVDDEVLRYTDSTPDLLNNGRYTSEHYSEVVLEPWRGVLLFVSEQLELVFDAGAISNTQPVPRVDLTKQLELRGVDAAGSQVSITLGTLEETSPAGISPTAPALPLFPGTLQMAALQDGVLLRRAAAPPGEVSWVIYLESSYPPVDLTLTHNDFSRDPQVVSPGGQQLVLRGGTPATLQNGKYNLSMAQGDPRMPEVLFKVGPNPVVGGAARFELDAVSQGRALVRIFSVNGARVWQESLELSQGANSWEWNLQNVYGRPVPSGVYLVHVASSSQTYTGRITVLR